MDSTLSTFTSDITIKERTLLESEGELTALQARLGLARTTRARAQLARAACARGALDEEVGHLSAAAELEQLLQAGALADQVTLRVAVDARVAAVLGHQAAAGARELETTAERLRTELTGSLPRSCAAPSSSDLSAADASACGAELRLAAAQAAMEDATQCMEELEQEYEQVAEALMRERGAEAAAEARAAAAVRDSVGATAEAARLRAQRDALRAQMPAPAPLPASLRGPGAGGPPPQRGGFYTRGGK